MPNRTAHIAAVLLLVTAIAARPSSASRTELALLGKNADPCPLRPEDSVFVGATPVYRDCAVTTKAFLLTNDIHADFTPSRGGPRCYSVELEYVVNEKGEVETATARVVKTNNQMFAEAQLSILPQWKFEPAKLNDVPVRQIVVDKKTAQVMSVVVPSGSGRAAASSKAA
ncbi:MAG: energy transducer TonB, partial [bacterium]